MARGGKKGKRGGGRGGGANGSKQRNPDERTDLIEQADMQNERFFAYYKAQQIVPEDEWDAFVGALRGHLPTTFRVAGSRQVATTLNTMIKELHVPNLSNVVFEGQEIPPPVQLPWYPDGLAWQFNVPKKVLRKSPEFKKFHSFLVFETEVGNISRQEAVSMLPPLFLEVEPHHKCMDMCAAPGSKTAQILEALHAADTESTASIPPGLLIANDSDNKRTHLLIHQSARLPSPALMVTNLDASGYPGIKVPAHMNQNVVPAVAGAAPVPGERLETLLFDRILCDVPCSGDGTIRKNMGIWKSWLPMDGNGLHALQLRILQRAMNMLKSTGRIVYSTCSLNPVENEAVVASALLTNKDFVLVDVSDKLPSLIRRPGLTTWRPACERAALRTFESYEECMASDVDENVKAKMSRGQWPPEEGVEALALERCMRIYPHLQDTGGFFVAVLEKRPRTKKVGPATKAKRELTDDVEAQPDTKRARIDDDTDVMQEETERIAVEQEAVEEATSSTIAGEAIDVDAESSLPDAEEPVDVGVEADAEANIIGIAEEVADAPQPSGPTMRIGRKLARGEGGFKENPYTFLAPDDPVLVSCLARLHISNFPSLNVLVRNPAGAAARSLYLANDLVKAVITHNSFERLRLTAAGTKVFAKQEGGSARAAATAAATEAEADGIETGTAGAEAQFRVLGEGLPVVLPYVDESFIIEGDMAALRTLVEAYYPLCATFAEPFRGKIEARASGSHIVRFPLGNLDGASLTHDLVLPIWKSNVSVTLMTDKKAKSALSLRLFGADITTAGQQAQAQKEKEIEKSAA